MHSHTQRADIPNTTEEHATTSEQLMDEQEVPGYTTTNAETAATLGKMALNGEADELYPSIMEKPIGHETPLPSVILQRIAALSHELNGGLTAEDTDVVNEGMMAFTDVIAALLYVDGDQENELRHHRIAQGLVQITQAIGLDLKQPNGGSSSDKHKNAFNRNMQNLSTLVGDQDGRFLLPFAITVSERLEQNGQFQHATEALRAIIGEREATQVSPRLPKKEATSTKARTSAPQNSEKVVADNSAEHTSSPALRTVKPLRKKLHSGSDGTGRYLEQIGVYPLLDAEEERELSQLIEAGREVLESAVDRPLSAEEQTIVQRAAEAKQQFYLSNLRLVVSIAKRYNLPPGMELDDLVQEGNIGLERAVEKFDWRKGFRFSTYAVFWIRQAITKGLNDQARNIRLPGGVSLALDGALKEVDDDPAALSSKMRRIHDVSRTLSADQPLGDEPDADNAWAYIKDESPPPDAIAVEVNVQELVQDMLAELSPSMRMALQLRFGIHDGQPRKIKEVGEAMGTTTQYAQQLINRAKKILLLSYPENRKLLDV